MMISGGTVDRHGDAAYADTLVTGAQWVLVACAVWGGLVLAAASVELLTHGRTRALTWVAAPPVVRRLVLALLGAALVGVPTSGAIAAADPSSSPSAIPSATPSTPAGPALVVPGPDDLPAPARVFVDAAPPRRAAEPGPATTDPSDRPHRVASPGSTRPGRPARPAPAVEHPTPDRSTGDEVRRSGAARPTHRPHEADETHRTHQTDRTRREVPTVRVAPGDCLWTLARRHLPASATDAALADWVAEAHRLNAAVIGPDPDLLRPGTRLVLPASP